MDREHACPGWPVRAPSHRPGDAFRTISQLNRPIEIKYYLYGAEAKQYSFIYLARRHGISCLEARMVLEVSGGSRQKSTYYANVLSTLPKSPRSKPDARAKVFRAWVESPLI